ncbi:DUF2332 domain-containing protein [Cryobacterium psychrophilum]|uniref:DUF2332 domain-containing protein n=1 Tax=Cryobacterium psychrophilum TaxID=41988 RepID=A0A4Y8KMH0_9MICO|nr:DUF2332 domain-containing protein [Cryobacterium psychrophilum]TFD78405.1 DUF2332 domain-containing protein [Cryobacterium psychrophilum]
MRRSTDRRASTPDRYREFAESEARGLSACYEEWASGIAHDPAMVALIDRLPAVKRQPNLVFSAARFCGATAGPYVDFARWLPAHWPEVEAVCRTHSTQTNEAGRCATLLPALASLRGPLALIEVGASAGLCLHPDRYSYRYVTDDGHERILHPATGPSPVLLDCAVSGPAPIPEQMPEVVWRAGIDLNPLDVNSASDMNWLEALIWPEHDDRRARLRAAIAVARQPAVEIVRGDLNEQLAALVARAPEGATIVVFHTAVLLYLDGQARGRLKNQLATLPVRWLANEGRGVVPGVLERLSATPTASSDFVLALDGTPIAFTQPHGRSLHWLG